MISCAIAFFVWKVPLSGVSPCVGFASPPWGSHPFYGLYDFRQSGTHPLACGWLKCLAKLSSSRSPCLSCFASQSNLKKKCCKAQVCKTHSGRSAFIIRIADFIAHFRKGFSLTHRVLQGRHKGGGGNFASCLRSPDPFCMQLNEPFLPQKKLAPLDGRNRVRVIAESLARVIAVIRITSIRWRSYLPLKTQNLVLVDPAVVALRFELPEWRSLV